MRVVLGEGAASLRGRVVTEKEGASLPDRLRVHLAPAEPDSANDTLRFFDAEIQSDGSFNLTNLAPGRYLLFTRPRTEEEAKQRSPRPLAWNATARAGLHRMAQAANTTIELKPCQRVADYKFRFAPPTEVHRKASSRFGRYPTQPGIGLMQDTMRRRSLPNRRGGS